MSELFWRSVIYVLIRSKFFKPYVYIVDKILDAYCKS